MTLLLEDPSTKPFLLHPLEVQDYPSDLHSDWYIAVQSPTMKRNLRNHGQDVFGLDSWYKGTLEKLPCWLLVAQNQETGEGVLGGIVLAGSHSRSDYPVRFTRTPHSPKTNCKNSFMKDFKESMNTNPDKSWKPVAMIDKDAAERKGESPSQLEG